MALLEYRIHANYCAGARWRWEVATDRGMIASGLAETHAQARLDMMSAVAATPIRKPLRSPRVLTLHPTWYGRLSGVWKARTDTNEWAVPAAFSTHRNNGLATSFRPAHTC
jgi:hypothetical protein